jgi:hypothetical protein
MTALGVSKNEEAVDAQAQLYMDRRDADRLEKTMSLPFYCSIDETCLILHCTPINGE